MTDNLIEALERIADPRNKHFSGDAQVVAREALAAHRSQQEAVQEPVTHVPGCEALGGYGHGVGPCTCASPAPSESEATTTYSHASDCSLHNAPAYEPGLCDCMPTPAMCRAAVEYLNGPEVYTKVPAEALAIEESIYAEVWKVMHASRPGAALSASGQKGGA